MLSPLSVLWQYYGRVKKTIRINIPVSQLNEPIVYKMVSTYSLIPNIKEANLSSDEGGSVLLEIEGLPADIERGILFLKELDIHVDMC